MATFKVLCLALCSLAVSNAASVASNLFAHRVVSSKVDNKNEDYITGMAASRNTKDLLWMVSSLDGENFVFGVDANTGKEVAWLNVTGAENYDWEDLAIGPCVDDCRANGCVAGEGVTRYCLYIADIGGDSDTTSKGNVYMIREPTDITPNNGSVFMTNVSVVDKLTFSWSETDAETLMISPDGRLFVISKVDTGRGMIAQIPDRAWGNTVALDLANTGVLKIYTDHFDPQGGSISPDGDEMVLVCEEDVFYYRVSDGDYINAVRTQIPERVASYVPVYDAEAITWSPNAQGFYTFSKGSRNFIYYYPRNNDPIVG